ncbi:phosphotransferase enzyme family protein [Nannizzia gypsea CBS 118893]|uniref:Phosphotransferase enzyme family protein n=1 Tax=Arthroderma gypseum (strain ATCC MYA-4604 / CBS 118893) TaxID=535722 RepID=E4V0S9_ARTGP|nr:phosphotransferase enzyme family protein [Nannizzia gypsea CBS 118893]EFR03644.1 phosphotransferase enzyme family protein [Nannizzia gypsea CBS 118893]
MEFDCTVSQKQEQKNPRSACRWKGGAFNIYYRVRYEDGVHLIVRFAALGKAILRQEKVKQEVATMNNLRHNTSIPVPEVLGSGTCWSGPYTVMPFVEGVPLSELLEETSKEVSPVLNTQLSDRSLKRAYHEMATLVLELSKPKFDTIGAPMKNEGSFSVGGRPVTFSMNELMLSAIYMKAISPYAPLGYIAMTRLSNVLIDIEKFCVSGAIDWEFTYVAPAEFSSEGWESDLNQFIALYTSCFRLFLEALRESEDKMIELQTLTEQRRLSPQMEHSMETGLFWAFIDEKHHGPFTSIDDRVQNLSDKHKDEINDLFTLKMSRFNEDSVKGFDDHYPIDELLMI